MLISSTQRLNLPFIFLQTKYKDFTFIWSEISFLSKWYESAHDARKANLIQLLEEKRFEIVTGGWVMTDEANVDVFSMVHQLTEGACLSFR